MNCKVCLVDKPNSDFTNGYNTCKKCRNAKNAETNKRRLEAKISESRICSVCDALKSMSEFTSLRSDAKCKECRKRKQNSLSKRRYNKLKSIGLCVDCGINNIFNNSVFCENCLEKHRKIHRKQARDTKKICVEYKGNKCLDCGIQTDRYEIYDFHHINPLLKDTKIAEMIHKRYPFEEIKLELDRCVLLCSNCHRTRHWDGE